MNRQFWIRKTTGALFCAGAVALVGCNNPQPPSAVSPATSIPAAAPALTGSAAQAAAPYAPPSASQLYQMVAPIALFPDKLVAQVLAGSTYPDEITTADGVVSRNPRLKGADLQTAIALQPWDASVKGLTAFPSVLDQMAMNIDWTTALGEAYVNDPTDVMNAIQVMRARASKHGSLHDSAQLRVVTQSLSTAVVDDGAEDIESAGNDDNQAVYRGPAMVPAPQQIIEIEPAQSDTVYVPQYDSQTVYGDEVASYPGYEYRQPREYSTGQLVGVGAVSFGVGILVGALIEQHDDQPRGNDGWNSWGMHWRDHGSDGARGDQWQQPAVIHNNSTYVSRSTTVVNHYVTNNINNSRNLVYNRSNVSSNNQQNTTINNRQRIDNHSNNDNRPIDNHDVRGGTPTFASRSADIPTANFHTPVPGARRPMSMPNFSAANQPARPQALPPRAFLTADRQQAAVVARARPSIKPVQEPRHEPTPLATRATGPAEVHAERGHQQAPFVHRVQTAHVDGPRPIEQGRHEPRVDKPRAQESRASAPLVPRTERPRAVAVQQVRREAPRPAPHPAEHPANHPAQQQPPAHKPEEKKHLR